MYFLEAHRHCLNILDVVFVLCITSLLSFVISFDLSIHVTYYKISNTIIQILIKAKVTEI
jgi:hypothetical protein